VGWINNQDPTVSTLQETHFTCKGKQLESERIEKIFHMNEIKANSNAILISG
jgi:hypothetical protein